MARLQGSSACRPGDKAALPAPGFVRLRSPVRNVGAAKGAFRAFFLSFEG